MQATEATYLRTQAADATDYGCTQRTLLDMDATNLRTQSTDATDYGRDGR